MGAPNPWHHSLPPLDPGSVLLEGENPLEIIRELLLRWPGEATVKQKDRVRHERLIQIIAGYPKIDFGRFPLDWLLNPLSIKAMRLSRFLDSLPSPDGSEKSSLRSALLNKSMHIDSNSYEDIKPGHKRIMALLFLGIRKFDPPREEGLNPDELRLLSSLHSSEKLDWWPIEELTYVQDFENHSKNIRKGMCRFWVDDSDLVLRVKSSDLWGIKFNKIQRWITMCSGENYNDDSRENPVGPALIRGSSAILESILSSIRHCIVSNLGVYSIIVDGGGRIEFISPDIDPTEMIQRAIKSSLKTSESYTPYFYSEINKLVELLKENRFEKQNKLIEDLSKNFPPYTIYQKSEREQEEKILTLHRSSDCIFCNERIKVKKEDIGSKWERFFLNMSTECCDFHRLLFFSGRTQRLVDSSVREMGKSIQSIKKQRSILAICRLDLNSLGYLFRTKFSWNKDENDLEIVRRRSFRFNSQWWEIVQSVVDHPDFEVDRIAAWMAAGDDIILAENDVQSDSESHLEDILVDLSNKIKNLCEREHNSIISFSAGVAVRQKDEPLSRLLQRSTSLEETCKKIWRKRMVDLGNDEYTLDTSGNQKATLSNQPSNIRLEHHNLSSWLWE